MSKRLLICCICGGRQRIYLRKVALTPPLSNYSLSLGIATTFLLQWIARIQHRTTCTKLLRFCLSSEIHWKLGTKLQLAEKKGEYNCIDCTSTCHGVAPLKKYTQLRYNQTVTQMQNRQGSKKCSSADQKNNENKTDFVNI